MRNIFKVAIVMFGLLGASSIWGRDLQNKMSIPNYITARTVKVGTIHENGQTSWGTGMFIGNGLILTEYHVISDKKELQDIEISTNGAMQPLFITNKAISWGILKYDSTEFIPTKILFFDESRDLAVLKITDLVNPSVILEKEFFRGEQVFAIGNPGKEDFAVVETTIKGIYPKGIGKELHSMIMIDSKGGKIGHGFSGGALVDKKGGVLGVVEFCWEELELCGAISSNDVKKYIEEVK